MALLSVEAVTRRFGGLVAVNAMDLVVDAGDLVSVIGPNGAGKTTLFNMIGGQDSPDAGRIIFAGGKISGLSPERIAGAGLGRTFQHGRVFANLTVMENLLIGAHTRLLATRMRLPVIGPLSELFFGLLGSAAIRRQEAELREEGEGVLRMFGERLLPRRDLPAYSLSYANRRRVEIARALMLRPKMLLLDEPTAGMNQTETAEMLDIIRMLKDGGQTILLIEHKLDLVMRLSDRVVVMDDGIKIAEGLPDAVRGDPAVVTAYLGHSAVGAGVAREVAA